MQGGERGYLMVLKGRSSCAVHILLSIQSNFSLLCYQNLDKPGGLQSHGFSLPTIRNTQRTPDKAQTSARLPKRENARRPSGPRLLSAHNTQHSEKARQSSNLCSITKTQTTLEAFNAFPALKMQNSKRPECNINHETLKHATYPYPSLSSLAAPLRYKPVSQGKDPGSPSTPKNAPLRSQEDSSLVLVVCTLADSLDATSFLRASR